MIGDSFLGCKLSSRESSLDILHLQNSEDNKILNQRRRHISTTLLTDIVTKC